MERRGRLTQLITIFTHNRCLMTESLSHLWLQSVTRFECNTPVFFTVIGALLSFFITLHYTILHYTTLSYRQAEDAHFPHLQSTALPNVRTTLLPSNKMNKEYNVNSENLDFMIVWCTYQFISIWCKHKLIDGLTVTVHVTNLNKHMQQSSVFKLQLLFSIVTFLAI